MSEQTSVTSPARPSVLPDSWISKIFDHMSGLYGSKFADLWRGTDLEAVKRIWAEKLAGFQPMPKAIKEALDALDNKPFPPTLPEFIGLCREAALRHQANIPQLEHKPTAEELEKAHEASLRAVGAIKNAQDKRGHREWVANLLQRQEKGEKLTLVQAQAIHDAGMVEVEI